MILPISTKDILSKDAPCTLRSGSIGARRNVALPRNIQAMFRVASGQREFLYDPIRLRNLPQDKGPERKLDFGLGCRHPGNYISEPRGHDFRTLGCQAGGRPLGCALLLNNLQRSLRQSVVHCRACKREFKEGSWAHISAYAAEAGHTPHPAPQEGGLRVCRL